MSYSECKFCGAKTISSMSKLRSDRFSPHICSKCGCKSYVYFGYKFLFIFYVIVSFWGVIGITYLFHMPFWLVIVIIPFLIYMSFIMVFSGNENRVYLNRKIEK